jgi:hypothetical protein
MVGEGLNGVYHHALVEDQSHTHFMHRFPHGHRSARHGVHEFPRLPIRDSAFDLEEAILASIATHVDATEVEFFALGVVRTWDWRWHGL